MIRLSSIAVILGTLVCAWPSSAAAETWTDVSGKFSVEAEFVGVQGNSIVLKKPDGRQITVPIAQLSPASREQAKSLYQKMRAFESSGTGQAASTGAASPNPIVSTRKLNFTAPTPPAVAPMPKFPDGLTMEQTRDFIKQQLLAGHPEVFWHALPSSMRVAMEEESVRSAVNPFIANQSQMNAQFEPLVFKILEILVTKKQFVLGSEMLKQLPPQSLPALQQAYDPAVGLIYELMDLGFSMDSLSSQKIGDIANYYGPRIGGHAKSLLTMVPPQMIDTVFESMEIEMIDNDHAIVRQTGEAIPGLGALGGPGLGGPGLGGAGLDAPGLGGPGLGAPDAGGALGVGEVDQEPKESRYVRVDQRWVPQDLADAFDPSTGKFKANLGEDLKQLEEANDQQTQAMMMMAGMMMGAVDAIANGLLAAQSQAEFDQALGQAMAALNPMGAGGGAGPGGGLPGGGFPGGLPGGFPGGLPEGALPDGGLPDGAFPDGGLPEGF